VTSGDEYPAPAPQAPAPAAGTIVTFEVTGLPPMEGRQLLDQECGTPDA